MAINHREKVRFAGIHFLLTCLILITITFVITNLWYPGDYFRLEDGWFALKYVFFVDVVVGPLLSYVVYSSSKQKKIMMMNIIVIVSLQLTALCAGMYTFYESRPAALVLFKRTFFVISNSEVDVKALPESVAKEILAPGVPEFITTSEKSTLDYADYQLLNQYMDIVMQKGFDLESLAGDSESVTRAYEDFLIANNIEKEAMKFFPVVGRGGTFLMAVSKEKGRTLGVIFVRPKH